MWLFAAQIFTTEGILIPLLNADSDRTICCSNRLLKQIFVVHIVCDSNVVCLLYTEYMLCGYPI